MEVSSNGSIKMNTVVHYPSRLVTRIIRASPDDTALSENKSAEHEGNPPPEPANIGLAEANKNKSRAFAIALAHEVRNPLTTIKVASEILESITFDSEHKRLVDIIKRSVVRANDLITEFLETSDESEFHSEICSVNELLEDVLRVNNDRILLKNILIIRNYNDTDLKILVRKNEIKIALINIIINAIDAMPSKHPVLILGTGVSGDKCFISIEDNGIGISEKNLENIFDPYYTNKPGGLGLGLSTTLDMLLANCGTLDVKSEEGNGTHFTLLFEIAAAHEK